MNATRAQLERHCASCFPDCDKCDHADECEQTAPKPSCFACSRDPQACYESDAAWAADGRVDK